jgi:hypothetical protein
MQPTLPRPLDLESPQWFVVSEAKIVNPCVKSLSFEPKKFNDEGVAVLCQKNVETLKNMSEKEGNFQWFSILSN